MNMPQIDDEGRTTAGRAVDSTIKGARVAARGGTRAGRWAVRNVLFLRNKSGAGEVGMIRLLDLHAASCAGDTLVTMGLATTVFFNAQVGQARGQVALYLLITMVPFAILAPIVGPLLDRFRHGRRYALAVTMFGRAFLAWAISDYIHTFGLYPAAFGVLALSRAYGVARSAAVPRLLPEGLGLSEAGARASVFGTLAGAVVAPLGIAALKIGPQWPLRVAAVIFIIGAIVALRLPPRADSDAPEVPPRIFQWGRRPTKVLSGKLVLAVLTNGAVLRAGYGFLALFLAFSIRSHDLNTKLFGIKLSTAWALGAAVGALGAGSLLATMVGSRLRIRRPQWLQAIGVMLVAAIAIIASIHNTLGAVILLSLSLAVVSGLAKLALDATIQERVPEDVRASAFAHSETLLMLAWVAGGAIGLIPFDGRFGIIVCAVGMTVATFFAWNRALVMRKERLSGSATETSGVTTVAVPEPAYRQEQYAHAEPPRSRRSRRRAAKAANSTTVRRDAGDAADQTIERTTNDWQPGSQPTGHPQASTGQAPTARTKPLPTRVLPREDRADVEQP